MTDQLQQPPVMDPDNVPETLCDGQINLQITGGLACLTFTHLRAEPGRLFADGTIHAAPIVRARIVTPVPNIVALKEMLNRFLVDADGPPPATATSGTRH